LFDPNHILGAPEYRKDQLLLEAAWRYQIIAPLVDGGRPKTEMQEIRKLLLRTPQPHPWRGEVKLTARTLRRWCRSFRVYRLAGLTLSPRKDSGCSRKLPAGVLDLAKSLIEEDASRGSNSLVQLMKAQRPDWKVLVARSTLDRHLRQMGYTFSGVDPQPEAYRTFEATEPGHLWQGDICHGPLVVVGGKRTVVAKIVCWIDDHSRYIVHLEAYPNEKLPAIEAALTRAILKHGSPLRILVDNGKVYSGKSFTMACSQLGIHKIHSAPYHPQSKGKQERVFLTLRKQLLNEVENVDPLPLEKLNRLLAAWVEAYHDTVHSETKMTPRKRFQGGVYRPAVLEFLEEAFLQWDVRKVSSQGKIEFAGQKYFVDLSLAHQKVIVRYNPFDLRRIVIWKDGRKLADATSENLVQRSLPRQARPDERKQSESAMRYLDSFEEAHQERLEREINLIQLPDQEDESK